MRQISRSPGTRERTTVTTAGIVSLGMALGLLAACGSDAGDGNAAADTAAPPPTTMPVASPLPDTGSPSDTEPPPAAITPPVADMAPGSPPPAASGFDPSSETATYRITFDAAWRADNGFGPVPAAAHFSDIIGAPVSAQSALWSAGSLASPGVEEVSEDGTTTAIRPEIDAEVAANAARGIVRIGDGRTEPGETTSAEIEFSSVFSSYTVITMVAPSPDWFVGLNRFALKDASGQWLDTAATVLRVYDAGTEEGNGFSPDNPATSPPVPIARLNIQTDTGLEFTAGLLNGVTPIASMRFERIR